VLDLLSANILSKENKMNQIKGRESNGLEICKEVGGKHSNFKFFWIYRKLRKLSLL